MAAKRLHDGYEQDGDQPDDNRMRRLPSFSTVIREAMMQKDMQSLLRCLEPLIRRVVQEEVEAGLMQSPRYIERAPETPAAERAAWKLAFRTLPQLPIFTGSKIVGEAGKPLEVVLVDAGTGSPVPRALRVELVPVFGDFPPGGREDWAADEFERSVVREREGKRPLLTGDVGLTLRDGRATVGELRFTDNSSWVRCRKFRIAARAVPGARDRDRDGGARVQEAVTEAFVVRDHRGEQCRKHYPPALADDVWRLEKIGKGGAFHARLRRRNVGTVQEFVRMLMVNPDELRAILGDGMRDRMWEATTSHARTCAPDDKVYAHATPHGTIYVDSIFNVVRVDVGGVEWPLQQLNRGQAMMVQQMLQHAYEHRHSLQEAFMLDGHTADNVPLLQNAAHVAAPAPVDTPLWFENAAEMDFPDDDDDEVPVPQDSNFGCEWAGQAFHMCAGWVSPEEDMNEELE